MRPIARRHNLIILCVCRTDVPCQKRLSGSSCCLVQSLKWTPWLLY